MLPTLKKADYSMVDAAKANNSTAQTTMGSQAKVENSANDAPLDLSGIGNPKFLCPWINKLKTGCQN